MSCAALKAPIQPEDVVNGLLIRGAARASGVRADALVSPQHAEVRRRDLLGVREVTSLGLLDAVMDLPLGAPVREGDVSGEALTRLAAAPTGIIERDGVWITRVLRPPVSVDAVVVEGRSWRACANLVGAFAPFAQMIVILDAGATHRLDVTWEAQVSGVGLWIRSGAQILEVVQPAPFVRRYWKPAAWRFREHAYGRMLRSRRPQESSNAATGRPSRSEIAESGQLALS